MALYRDDILKFVNWINKHITHNRDTAGDYGIRLLIHIPVGLLIGIPIIGWALGDLFIRYEQNEDLHTQDHAWKDYAGAMIGASIAEILTLVAIVAVLWRLLA